MKIPFSYRHHLFGPVLLTSVVGHLVFLGTGGFLNSFPKYAVKRAPSSVEVVLFKKQSLLPKRGWDRSPVLAIRDSLPEASKVFQERNRLVRPEKNVQKHSVTIPEKGAFQEKQPAYLKNPAPVYPRLAREQGWEGLVLLKVTVGVDGKPQAVTVEKSSGYQVLDDSAVRTVRTWQFLPARLGHLSLSSTVKIPVRFRLRGE